MWDCPACGKRHRKQEALERCKARARRREVLEKKRRIDAARRLANRKRESESAYIRRRYCGFEGAPAVRVAAELNREYPPREDGKKWTWFEVLQEHISHMNWPF